MNRFVINTNSHSYKFLNKVSKKFEYNCSRPRTFCQYYLTLLFNIIKVFFIYFILGTMTYPIMDNVVHLIYGKYFFSYDVDLPNLLNAIGFFVLFTCTIVLGVFIIVKIIEGISDLYYYVYKPRKERHLNHENVKKDGFLITAYKSYKEKYCPLVVYDDECGYDDGEE